jgi:hypothetical protein
MSDMALQVSADVGGAVTALQRVGAELSAVRRKALEAGAGLGKLSERARAGLPAAAKQAGQLGGQAGGMLSRFGGLMGGTGALGRLGIIAASAGLALQVMSAHAERAARSAEMLVRAQLAQRDAQHRAVQQREASARAGLDLAEQEQQLRAVGGPEALQALQRLLDQGISRGQATEGVRAAFANSSPEAADRLLELGRILARVGVPFGQAVQGLSQRMPRDSVLSRSEMPAMASVFADANNIRSPLAARDRLAGALANTSTLMPNLPGTQRNVQINAARAAENGLSEQQLADFSERFASLFARQLAEARAPEAAATLQVFGALQEQTLILQRQLDALGTLGRALDVAKSFWTGQGRAAEMAATQEVMGNAFGETPPVMGSAFGGGR